MKNKTCITPLIFILISLFLLFCAWLLLRGIQKDSAELFLEKNNILTSNAQSIEVGDFKKNYDAYKPNLEKIDQLFIDADNPVDFIKFLEDTSFKNKIDSQISLQSSEDSSFIILQISSEGSYPDALNFSKEIELGPYLIEIQNLTIQNSENDSEKDIYKNYSSRQVDATFNIKVFTKSF